MKNEIVVAAVDFVRILSVVFTKPALAYIDPNTGGQLFQLLAIIFASFSAILLFFSSQIRMGFNRLRRRLRELRNRSGQIESEDE